MTTPAPGIPELLTALDAGETIRAGSSLHRVMHDVSQRALRIAAELNGSYHEPSRVRELLEELTHAEIEESVTVFPPIQADFGRNIHLGRRVFINSGCRFQDQGGIRIGDDCLIGHNVVIATLNHDLDPTRRADITPSPVTIGRNVWVGSNATILPGVQIGDNAVIAAASVVTKDVPANTVVVGSPARATRAL